MAGQFGETLRLCAMQGGRFAHALGYAMSALGLALCGKFVAVFGLAQAGIDVVLVLVSHMPDMRSA